jgi:hypothetical protein
LRIFAAFQSLGVARQCHDSAAAQWSGLQVLLALVRERSSLILVCSAHVAYSSQAIMRLPQRLAHGKLLGECTYAISSAIISVAFDLF